MYLAENAFQTRFIEINFGGQTTHLHAEVETLIPKAI